MPHRQLPDPRAIADSLRPTEAMRERLLAERTRRLATRPLRSLAAPAVAAATAAERRLVVEVAGDYYGLALASAVEVLAPLPVGPVPTAPPAMIGLFAHRGRLYNLLDMAALLGSPRPRTPGLPKGRLLVLEDIDGAAIALLADAVLGAAPATPLPTEAEAAGSGEGALRYARAPAGALGRDPVVFALLDLPRLLHPFIAATTAPGA